MMKTLLVLLVAVLALASASVGYGGYVYYNDVNNDGVPDSLDEDRNGRPDKYEEAYGRIPYGLPTYGAPIPYVYAAPYAYGYGYANHH